MTEKQNATHEPSRDPIWKIAWLELPDHIRGFIESTLAEHPRQLEAWQLWHCRKSWRAIALIQGVSRTTARDRVDAANLRLRKAGLTQNRHGRFTIKETA